ncbi:MAG: asparagine synthase (glutamine-hydrolyzing) [Desulfobacterales bacterium]
MCGITGIFLRNGFADRKRLAESARSLSHRGPDHTDSFVDGPFGMAHTRLSIIDLGGGNQPLFARNGELALIANGEIYNFIELRRDLEKLGHRFTTRSDSEAILHAYVQYGKDFLKVLHGMFAFALYDKTDQRLILARDRLGIKPLFLAHLAGGVAFASEIKALLHLDSGPPQVDPAGLIEYLQNQFSCGRTTLLKGCERLLPGEAVLIEQGQVRERWRYWSALEIKPAAMDFEEARDVFDRLMEKVMRQHMRSDVPFGLFLSGGVDSAILLALLSRYKDEPIRTFSIGFSDSRLADELPQAERLARRFGSRHTAIRPDVEAIFHSLPYTVWAADDLMRDYASLPTAILAQAAAKELKVVFSGEGGDEVFAGYGRYRSSSLERWIKGILAPGSGGFRTRGTLRGRWPQRLLKPEVLGCLKTARSPFVEAWQATPFDWSDLQRMQYVDLVTALPDNLLVKLDRMLMGWGLEGRVPFLDHRVVTFGLGLPDDLKVNAKHGKAFLKRWALEYLPADHLYGPKRGFHVPVAEWIRGRFLTVLAEVLPRHAAIRSWFRPEGVAQLIRTCRSSGPGIRIVWALLQFAIWHHFFIDGKGQRPPVKLDPLEILDR